MQVIDVDDSGEGVGFNNGDFGSAQIQVGHFGQSAEGKRCQTRGRNPVQAKVIHFRQAPKCVGFQGHHGSGMGDL